MISIDKRLNTSASQPTKLNILGDSMSNKKVKVTITKNRVHADKKED